MMKPFFSIIIPVYNVAPYLRECLDSVLAQTFTDWEAICVDDGSSDGSGAIIDEYAAKDERFHIVHQENMGVGAARNRGLENVSCKWVLFLDGDDVWNVELLSTVARMIEDHPSQKLFRFGFERFKSTWSVTKKEVPSFDWQIVDISKDIAMHDFVDYLFWCFAYSKELFENLRFPQYKRGEDRCVLNRILLERINSFVVTTLPLYGYRNRLGSAVNSIPSVKVLLDEMDHRIDIAEMIDASDKVVEYSHADWLVPYFLSFPRKIAHRYDSLILWREWVCRTERLSKLKLISRDDRIALQQRYKKPTKWWWFMVEILWRIPIVPIRQFYRCVMRHGEYGNKDIM